MTNTPWTTVFASVIGLALIACEADTETPRIPHGHRSPDSNVAVTLTITSMPRRRIEAGGFERRLNRVIYVPQLPQCKKQISEEISRWASHHKYSIVTKAEAESWLIMHVLPIENIGFYEFYYKISKDKTREVISFVLCSAAGKESSPSPSPATEAIVHTLERVIQCL